MIIDKLIDKINELKNPTVVGLDPRLEYIPHEILHDCQHRYGNTLISIKYALLRYNMGLIDALHDIIPAIKPQIAFYEQYGSEGIDAYIQTIQYAKKKGLIVIGDIKRSDIASTAEAYSNAHIGEMNVFGAQHAAFNQDFTTVNPYLGADSIEPFLKNCHSFDKGLFVLVKTSNKGSSDFQDLKTDGKCIYEVVGDAVAKWGEELVGKHGYSCIGAVVGATHPEIAANLRLRLPKTFFLVPGYGSQGGSAKDIAVNFDKNGSGAIINNSRGIIAAYLSEKYKHLPYGQAARAAAIEMQKELNKAL